METENQDTPDTNTEVVQHTEIEVEAMNHGWRPKEDFDANEANAGKKWRTAEEFMDRKSLFDKIDSQHREIKDLKRGLTGLAEHNAKIEKSAYDRALSDLRAERKIALEEGNLVRAEEIRDQIDDIKDQKEAVQVQPVVTDLPPEVLQWREQNSWYERDLTLTSFADGLGQRLIRRGMAPAEVMAEVTRQVRENFPEKFRNPNKDNAPKMEAGTRRTPKQDSFRLNPEEERVMRTLIRAGAPIKEDEYIAQIKKLRGEG